MQKAGIQLKMSENPGQYMNKKGFLWKINWHMVFLLYPTSRIKWLVTVHADCRNSWKETNNNNNNIVFWLSPLAPPFILFWLLKLEMHTTIFFFSRKNHEYDSRFKVGIPLNAQWSWKLGPNVRPTAQSKPRRAQSVLILCCLSWMGLGHFCLVGLELDFPLEIKA